MPLWDASGLTFSSEKKDKKGTWFLNLQQGEFDEAVLLCEITGDAVLPVSLPKGFLDRSGRSLSRDSKRQIKFNVVRQNNRYFLQIPDPVGPVDVTENVDREILRYPRTSIYEMA